MNDFYQNNVHCVHTECASNMNNSRAGFLCVLNNANGQYVIHCRVFKHRAND